MDILYFEPTDEVTKAIERVKASGDIEVALVLPRGSLILQSIVNLKLIARAASSVKKKLSIVTVDKIGRNLALQVGIPVFGRVVEGRVSGKMLARTPQPVTPQALREQLAAETEELTSVTGLEIKRYDSRPQLADPADTAALPTSAPNSAPPTSRDLATRGKTVTHLFDQSGKEQRRSVHQLPPWLKKTMIIIGATVAVAAAGWLYWFYPKTAVTVTVTGEPHQTEMIVTAGTSSESDLPLAVLTTDRTGQKTVPASGTKDVGERAAGNITLVNQYSTSPQSIAAGSTLTTTGGLKFLTTTGVVIPGADIAVEGTSTTLKQSGRVQVAIVAENAGEQYNISSGRLSILGITEQKDGKVFGENPSTSGGTSETRAVVTPADIDAAREAVAVELTNAAVNEALAKLTDHDVIDEATAIAITQVTSDKQAGEESGEVKVEVAAKTTVLAINQAELHRVLEDSVNSQLAADKIFTISEDGLTYTVHSLNIAGGRVQLATVAKGNIAAKIDRDALLAELRGHSTGRAEQQLRQTVPFFKSVEFRRNPAWMWRRLAPAANASTLKIEYAP